MAVLVKRGSIGGTARDMSVDKDSVARWLRRAEEHREEVTEYLFWELE